MEACSKGNIEILKYLVAQGGRLDGKDVRKSIF